MGWLFARRPRTLWALAAAGLCFVAGCGDGGNGDGSGNVVDGADPPDIRQSVEPRFLRAEGEVVVDELDRQVILRGLNHIGLRSDRNHPGYREDGEITPPAARFELQDLQPEDFDTIASLGFNTLRLVVTWEFAQPDPPPAPYNETYFRLIDEFIAKAKARGMNVIFDFGQFGWGRSVGGNAGAPDWTVASECRDLPGPLPNAPPQASTSVGCAYFNFWENESVDGVRIQDAYINLWRFVAERYKDEPAVSIYDLYNEPFGGAIPPGPFEYQYLYPFYRRLAAAIRDIDPRHPVGFQPEIFNSIGIPTPFVAPIGIDNAIYVPHEYTAAYFLQRIDPAYTPAQGEITRAYFTKTTAEAGVFGTPHLIGETGWTRSTNADGVGGPIPSVDRQAPVRFAEDLTALTNEMHTGWAWFAYSSIDQAYGINYQGEIDEPLMRALAEPFPRATAGRLASFSFDTASGIYEQTTTDLFDAPSEIALPLDWQYPDGACVIGDGEPVAEVGADGAVQPLNGVTDVRFLADSATLEIQPLPEALRIEPGDCAG